MNSRLVSSLPPADSRVLRRRLLAAAALLLTRPSLAQDGGAAEEGGGGGEGVLVMMEELQPFSFLDEQRQPAGYAVELARELLTRADLPGSFEIGSWTRVLAKGRGRGAVLIPAIVRLPEREKEYYWLGSIARRRGMVYRLKRRREVKPRNFEELRHYRTAVVIGDASEREMLRLGLDPSQHLDRCADYAVALRRLFAGRVDLLSISQGVAPTVLKQHGYPFEAMEPVLKLPESLPSMALSLATDAPTRQKLQRAFDAMKRDGRMAEIAARYPTLPQEP
ncbi:ABC transporter substrate-binding protein [Paucibacter sp. KBW04]|uniref:substrate-binding periplasmic protein n=1 Tax=Paucibacter sp. KBW04 TaxID=2153361 RepID=UPI000F55B935|nr:transporter substrate-binding domain-containing protein [Paucibacter sp. KBW04]